MYMYRGERRWYGTIACADVFFFMILVGITDVSSVCACYQSVLLSTLFLHFLSPPPLHGDQGGHSCLLMVQTLASQTHHSGEPLPISCCNACL